MAKSSESTIEAQLEQKLNLKQLQINRLLNITQAINENIPVEGLFKMYTSFLNWEMGVDKLLLFIKRDEEWAVVSDSGIKKSLLKIDITPLFPTFKRVGNLEKGLDPLLDCFDVVIPVKHKEQDIAFLFIGGLEEDDEMYNKVQFITTITNIIAVAIENKRLFKRQLEQSRMKREMELASEMQMHLVPSKLPSDECYELASIYKPQLGVGGDYFDYIDLSDEEFAFCVADISGKGVAAALLMANFQASLNSLIRIETDAAKFIRALNEAIYKVTQGDRFITFFVAKFNKKTRQLRYINAGHNPPFMFVNGELIKLDKGCTFLGSFENIPGEIGIGEVHIPGKAMALLYTDGLSDLRNEKDVFLTDEFIEDLVTTHHKLPAGVFNDLLLERIEAFKGSASYPDDLTVLTAKFFKPY
jgi:sigma-B regulation protein RsbU (phosphoserine phosphatase)